MSDAPPPAKLAHRFSYYSDLRSHELPLPHKQRDGDATLELMDVLLCERGYRYGDLILNPKSPDGRSAPDVEAATLALRPEDLLVMTTRPPLSDADQGTKRVIDRSHTSLDTRVAQVVRSFITVCSVQHLLFDRRVADVLRHPLLAARSDVLFWVNESSRHARSAYRAYRRANAKERRTLAPEGSRHTMAVLILIESQAWPGGPGLLCSFALGGTQTLAFNHLLRVSADLRPLLREPGSRIVLADMAMDPPVREDWADLRPAERWKIELEEIPLCADGHGGWMPDPRAGHRFKFAETPLDTELAGTSPA